MGSDSKILPNSLYGQYNASANYLSSDRAAVAARQNAQSLNQPFAPNGQSQNLNLGQVFAEMAQNFATSGGASVAQADPRLSGTGARDAASSQNGANKISPQFYSNQFGKIAATLVRSNDTHNGAIQYTVVLQQEQADLAARNQRHAQATARQDAQAKQQAQHAHHAAFDRQMQNQDRSQLAADAAADAPSSRQNSQTASNAASNRRAAEGGEDAASAASDSSGNANDPSQNANLAASQAGPSHQANQDQANQDQANQDAAGDENPPANAVRAPQDDAEAAEPKSPNPNGGAAEQAASSRQTITFEVPGPGQGLSQRQSDLAAAQILQNLADAAPGDTSLKQALQQMAANIVNGQTVPNGLAGAAQDAAMLVAAAAANGGGADELALNISLTTQLQTMLSGTNMTAKITGTGNSGLAGQNNGLGAIFQSGALVSLAEQAEQNAAAPVGGGGNAGANLNGNLGRALIDPQDGADAAAGLSLLHADSELDFGQILHGTSSNGGMGGGGHGLLSSNISSPTANPQMAQPSRLLPMIDQVARPVFLAATQGQNEISIQMQPQTLGRVGVAMKFGADGKVTANVTADRPETLALLKSDAAGLQQALQDAGFQADMEGLSFSLSHDGGQNNQGGQQHLPQAGQGNLVSLQEIDGQAAVWQTQPSNSLVDIRI